MKSYDNFRALGSVDERIKKIGNIADGIILNKVIERMKPGFAMFLLLKVGDNTGPKFFTAHTERWETGQEVVRSLHRVRNSQSD